MTECEEIVASWFREIGETRDQKLDHYAALIRELEARAEVRKAESQRLADRARIDADRASFLKDRLRHFFLGHGLKTVETRRYRITLAGNGGRNPILLRVPPESLPEVFRSEIVTVKANLDDIRAYLEAGGVLQDGDGNVMAELGERGSSIRIR